jgi:hypothetical protein
MQMLPMMLLLSQLSRRFNRCRWLRGLILNANVPTSVIFFAVAELSRRVMSVAVA